MNLKFIKEEDVAQLNTDVKHLYNEIIVDGKTIEQYLGKENVVQDSNVLVNDFTLTMPEGDPVLSDLENVKRTYKAMIGLSASQASDERIWLAYSLQVCKDYMNYRWPATDANAINNRWLFGYTNKRSLFRHGIARLWWIGYCTYDKNRSDPFELTAYVVKKQDIINQLLDIGFNGNKTLVFAIIEGMMDAEKEGKTIGRDEVRKVSKYINSLGAVYLLDSLSHDEIYHKVKNLFA